jgi:hypothetical protein
VVGEADCEGRITQYHNQHENQSSSLLAKMKEHTMKALICSKSGPPEVLQHENDNLLSPTEAHRYVDWS